MHKNDPENLYSLSWLKIIKTMDWIAETHFKF